MLPDLKIACQFFGVFAPIRELINLDHEFEDRAIVIINLGLRLWSYCAHAGRENECVDIFLPGDGLQHLVEPAERRVRVLGGGEAAAERGGAAQLGGGHLPPHAGRGQPLQRGGGQQRGRVQILLESGQ